MVLQNPIHMPAPCSRSPRTAPLALFTLLALVPTAQAQQFKLGLGGGLSCYVLPCGVPDLSSPTPLFEARSCSSPGVPGALWDGFALADCGLLVDYASVYWPGINTGCAANASRSELHAPVTVSGPAAASVAVSVTVEVAAASNQPQGISSGASVQATGSLGGSSFNTGPLSNPNFVTPFVLAGSVVPNVPTTLNLSLSVGATAGFLTAHSRSCTGSIRLLPGATVFTVPAGYTVNSPELNIVNNVWLGPTLGPSLAPTPSVVTACGLDDVTLDVAATGTNLTYQWRKAGASLSNGPAPGGSTISGATTAQLSIQDLSTLDEGDYDCVVSNAAGSATSAPTALHVSPPAASYCAAKLTSNGCTPSIGSTGMPSASASSGFVVSATGMINNKPCILLYGTSGPDTAPFQGGTLCLAPPVRRTPGGNSLGNPPPNDCSGAPSIDMNAFAAGTLGGTPLAALSVPGTVVHCQWWGRDPGFAAPDNSQLSNGLQYTVCQ